MELLVRDLDCARGGRPLFTGLTFAAPAGSLTLLRGANGAGKTSLLRIIAGLAPPDRGDLILTGGDNELTIGQQCHFIAHRDAIKPHLTLRENLRFWRDFLGGGDIDEALAAFALAHLADLQAAILSSGQRRRLALARLAMVPRPLWLLDEPTVGLDDAALQRLAALMTSHMGDGGIILAATHVEIGIAGAAILLGTPLTVA